MIIYNFMQFFAIFKVFSRSLIATLLSHVEKRDIERGNDGLKFII